VKVSLGDNNTHSVMPGFVPGIHAFVSAGKTWMAASSPAMTNERL